MSIIVNRETRILIQGITGKSGMQTTQELLDYGMQVVGGVTPGKGGQEVSGVPVFNSVKEAVEAVGPVDVSQVYVPPLMALDASREAIGAGIKFLHIFVEKIPVLDTVSFEKVNVLSFFTIGFFVD